MRKKILSIIGTRPEAIKLAPVIKRLKASRHFISVVCATAQHREMLDQVLRLFEIVPDYDLNIMRKNQSLYEVSSICLKSLHEVIEKEEPDLVLVQGDTTTTFIGSLAAFYAKVRIGHIEAGLRSYNKYSPFPEEINRRLTSNLADSHFAPTQKAKENLLNEGIKDVNIFVTGNTVIDSLQMVSKKQSSGKEQRKIDVFFKKEFGIIFDHSRRILLVTGHRRENFGAGLKNICNALKELALEHPDTDIVFPVHLNLNVQVPVKRILSGIKNIFLIRPLEYASFVYLMSKAYIILTDSGGIQEEAPSIGKPVLVMRAETERPEAVDAGTVRIVGTDKEKIIREVKRLLRDGSIYKAMTLIHNPYGDGRATHRIIKILNNKI